MGTCFVIQPFDGGAFDKRYEDVLVPAIEATGLEAYRVDRDPTVSIPIDQIEDGIRKSDACLADISTNNPNVWFELGYAIAAGKEVVLVCTIDPERRFPFDIQHRSIIRYRTESARDFEELKQQITARLAAILSKEEKLGRIVQLSSIAEVEGLAQHEMVALVSIAENMDSPRGSVSVYSIRKDMDRAGFTQIAVTVALAKLQMKDMIGWSDASDEYGNSYAIYSLTERGTTWLLENQDLLYPQNASAVFRINHKRSDLG